MIIYKRRRYMPLLLCYFKIPHGAIQNSYQNIFVKYVSLRLRVVEKCQCHRRVLSFMLCRSLVRNLNNRSSSTNSPRPRICAIGSTNAAFGVIVSPTLSRHDIEQRCGGLGLHRRRPARRGMVYAQKPYQQVLIHALS